MAKDISSVQAGTVKTNDVNDPTPRVIRGKNQFPQSFQHASTCQYGLVDLVSVAKCEPGDTYPYKFHTDLNTFTLKSPMKSKVNMYSAAFKVPMESIYPRNYDIMFPIPNKGDDVPSEVNNSTRALFSPYRLLDAVNNYMQNDSNNLTINGYLKAVFLLESLFSAGSIFSKVNIHMDSLLFDKLSSTGEEYVLGTTIDTFIDGPFKNALTTFLTSIANDTSTYVYYYDSEEISDRYVFSNQTNLVGTSYIDEDAGDIRIHYIGLERFVELMRSPDWNLRISKSFAESAFAEWRPIYNFGTRYFNVPKVINIESIVAYQLACAHFFNNPKIDYIYTAQLWRDNLENLWLEATGEDSFPRFEWNGLSKLYDVVSAQALLAMGPYDIARVSETQRTAIFAFWNALFGWQNSLRYGDYFTGSRPEPIAVGDITIDDPTSPLDVTRKLQLTRLLNKVNISGPKKDDYLRIVFGTRVPEAPKDVPIRLSLESFDVSGFEVNNTGTDQLSANSPNITTTNLRVTDSKFMFEVEIDEPCWLVMVQYFDAHRIYSKTIDRFAYHYDRYDDFIPDLQFTGDQEVMQSELHGIEGYDNQNFAYNLRYMEYKQRTSYASGGFIKSLKSWAMITDNSDGNSASSHINPLYIRSVPSEFDRFYKSLTGISLGTRFHFITFNTNIAVPYRQMVYAPEILA